MKIIDGKKLASNIRLEVKNKIEKQYINKNKQAPCLACIIVEGNSASEVYVASKKKATEECLMESRIVRLKETISQKELINEMISIRIEELKAKKTTTRKTKTAKEIEAKETDTVSPPVKRRGRPPKKAATTSNAE
ncbi:MAG: hypothetical protein IJD48_04710 [Clostridia bacterium]|nr:hypothetical protein [Clostridia bacterium]